MMISIRKDYTMRHYGGMGGILIASLNVYARSYCRKYSRNVSVEIDVKIRIIY